MERYGRMERIFTNDKCIMKIIFCREEFVLCDLPVPNGYPQSQTHCGIVNCNDMFYMTTSPYPNPKRPLWLRYLDAAISKITFNSLNIFYNGEDYENPMLYQSVGFTEQGIPIKFKLVKGSPLMNKPIDVYGFGSFCSDPDLSVVNDVLYVLNRTTNRGNSEQRQPGETLVHLIKGTVKEGEFIEIEKQVLFKEAYKSPCLINFMDRFVYFCLDTNSYNDGSPCKALLFRESSDLTQWSNPSPIIIDKGNYEPWHMSVFLYKGRLYAIIACVQRGDSHRCWQMLGEFSDDLSSLKIYQTPLTDYKSYRGSALVRDDGEFILYNTTVGENIMAGKSVDGRDVIMAHMPFDKLLSIIQEKE